MLLPIHDGVGIPRIVGLPHLGFGLLDLIVRLLLGLLVQSNLALRQRTFEFFVLFRDGLGNTQGFFALSFGLLLGPALFVITLSKVLDALAHTLVVLIEFVFGQFLGRLGHRLAIAVLQGGVVHDLDLGLGFALDLKLNLVVLLGLRLLVGELKFFVIQGHDLLLTHVKSHGDLGPRLPRNHH